MIKQQSASISLFEWEFHLLSFLKWKSTQYAGAAQSMLHSLLTAYEHFSSKVSEAGKDLPCVILCWKWTFEWNSVFPPLICVCRITLSELMILNRNSKSSTHPDFELGGTCNAWRCMVNDLSETIEFMNPRIKRIQNSILDNIYAYFYWNSSPFMSLSWFMQ